MYAPVGHAFLGATGGEALGSKVTWHVTGYYVFLDQVSVHDRDGSLFVLLVIFRPLSPRTNVEIVVEDAGMQIVRVSFLY